MGTFQAAVDNIKKQLAEMQIDKLYSEQYAIQTCNVNKFKTDNSLQIELLFLDNLEYIPLTLTQTKKILTGNYKNLFTRADDLIAVNNLKLQGPVQINNITNVFNSGNDLWEEFNL
jgi:hypothetical protein